MWQFLLSIFSILSSENKIFKRSILQKSIKKCLFESPFDSHSNDAICSKWPFLISKDVKPLPQKNWQHLSHYLLNFFVTHNSSSFIFLVLSLAVYWYLCIKRATKKINYFLNILFNFFTKEILFCLLFLMNSGCSQPYLHE